MRSTGNLLTGLVAGFLLVLIAWAGSASEGQSAANAPAAAAPPAVPETEAMEFFERKVRPLLVQQCYGCHSAQAKNVAGGLLVDTRSGLLIGGASGPALVPGDPDRSRLIQAVRQ